MINIEKPFNVHDYIEIFLRRIWYIIIPFAIALAGAATYALTSPKVYRASCLVLVTPQKVPETFVRPTVTSKIEDRLSSISQEIMSRTRLEQVISELKLYPEEAKSKSMEEIVEFMRRSIEVELKGKEGYFTISYAGRDPRVITTVANKLASLFIEENLKLREQQAQGTSEFLSIELNAMKAKLDEQEKAIAKFRRSHMGELPEQRETNVKVLEQHQLIYQRIGENLRSAQERKLVIQKQMSELKQMSDIGLLVSPPTMKEVAGSPPLPLKDRRETQLEQLREQLADLRSKYQEKHPDILIAKRRIAELEAKIEKEKAEKEKTEKDKPENKVEEKIVAVDESGPLKQEMEGQLIATESEIKRLQEEERKVKEQIDIFRERIENTPLREQEIALITRDYQNTKENYQTLLKKSQEAQQAENLERRQKGEQFRVIDPARIPEKPFKPNTPIILLLGLLLGTGSGFAFAFLREQMDHSFRDAEDLEATLGSKVLINIPKMEKKAA